MVDENTYLSYSSIYERLYYRAVAINPNNNDKKNLRR